MRISFARIASPLKASPVWPKRESRRFRGWESAFFQIPENTVETIPAGHGGIVWQNGKKTGVLKDKSGKRSPSRPGARIWAASWNGIPMSRVGIAPATAPGLTSREICWRVLRRPDFPTHKGTSTAFKAVSYGTAFLIAPAFFLWQSAFFHPSKTIAECDEKYQEWIFCIYMVNFF